MGRLSARLKIKVNPLQPTSALSFHVTSHHITNVPDLLTTYNDIIYLPFPPPPPPPPPHLPIHPLTQTNYLGTLPKPTMKKLISKLTPSSSSHPHLHPQPNEPNTIYPPTLLDILRYRFHHGTNLGSNFLLENWLFPALFPSSSSSSDDELTLVSTSLSTHGLAHTREILTSHYRSALSDVELAWLATDAWVTSIRLPLGYWILGPEFCRGTDFKGVAQVYEGAWAEVKELVRRVAACGIGVLLDLHGQPGARTGTDILVRGAGWRGCGGVRRILRGRGRRACLLRGRGRDGGGGGDTDRK